MSGGAHGDAGECGYAAGVQCAHCLLLREPAPPQRKPENGR